MYRACLNLWANRLRIVVFRLNHFCFIDLDSIAQELVVIYLQAYPAKS